MQNNEEIFKLGKQVEVTSNMKCFRNSWYRATVIPPPKPNNPLNKPRNKRVWVEYETIFDHDDPSKKLQEFTEILLIRPLPPIPTSGSNKFEKHDFVDAYHKDGWFTGVILDVINGGLKYIVAFLNPYEEFLYGRDEVRVHFEWIGGSKWTKVYSSQKVKVAFCPPNGSATVVPSLLESNSPVVSPVEHAPLPAKKLKRTISGNADERPSSDPNHAVQSLDAPQKFIRPRLLTSSSKVSFFPPNVSETVVAPLLESTSAKVSHVEQPPSLANKLKRKTSGDIEEIISSDRDNAMQSLDAPQKFLQPCPLTSNKCYTRCNRKRKASDGKSYSSLSVSSNNNVAFCPPDGGETVVASSLESTPAVVSLVEQAPSLAEKLKLTTSTVVILLAKDQEDNKKTDADSRSPAKGNQVTEVVDVIDKQVKVKDEQGDAEPAATESPQVCLVTNCSSGQSDTTQSWPFTKKSSVWAVTESMEVFKRIPQMPHFSPLTNLEENSREMIAISQMIKFSYEADRISALSSDDLNRSGFIQDTLKSLKELESHGFNTTPLKDSIKELVARMEIELSGNLEEVESGIRKCKDEQRAIERKVSELQEQIQSEKSLKLLKDLQLDDLESQKGILFRKLHELITLVL